jgi:hypothetical protein
VYSQSVPVCIINDTDQLYTLEVDSFLGTCEPVDMVLEIDTELDSAQPDVSVSADIDGRPATTTVKENLTGASSSVPSLNGTEQTVTVSCLAASLNEAGSDTNTPNEHRSATTSSQTGASANNKEVSPDTSDRVPGHLKKLFDDSLAEISAEQAESLATLLSQ